MARALTGLDQAIPPVKMAHFVLRTKQLDELKAWYSTVLGAQVVVENPMMAFMTFDDEHHRLALIQNPNFADRPDNAVGLEHFAYTLRDLEALLHTYRRLADARIRPYWCVNHGPTTSMYYRDPEGNQVEFQVDNFPSVEELQAWFRSDAFAKNPIGVNFDPDKLLARWEAGEPLEDLVQQGSA